MTDETTNPTPDEGVDASGAPLLSAYLFDELSDEEKQAVEARLDRRLPAEVLRLAGKQRYFAAGLGCRGNVVSRGGRNRTSS